MPEYYFLESKQDGRVIDVRDDKTAAGTPLIAFPPKGSKNDNQLWGFIVSDAPPFFFITVKQTGQVIDIKYVDRMPGTDLIAFPQKGSGTGNQLWMLVPSAEKGFFFIKNQQTRAVITLGEKKENDDLTPLVAIAQKPSESDDQLWSLVPAG